MPAPAPSGGIHLFRLFQIDVYLHWLWILVAVYEINTRGRSYSSIAWNVAEYLSLFLIVLLHEFGHALACKSGGGEAERILLWPMGGVAYVNPQQRPGAVLWSIAAGPLVNVVLAPVLLGAFLLMRSQVLPASPDLSHFVKSLLSIDVGLLIFNLLPIYPLDGGQILRALLWFVMGRSRSLMVASGIGLLGAAAAMAGALYLGDLWLIVLAAFGLMWSWNGLQQGRRIAQMLELPQHHGIACPACGVAPPAAPLWKCPCGAEFDTFAAQATCPQCGRRFETTACPHCGRHAPIEQWARVPAAPILPAEGGSEG